MLAPFVYLSIIKRGGRIMKTLALILAVMINVSVIAQTAPTYNKVNGMIKITKYHDNGSIKEIGYFIDDKKAGVWENFNEKGVKVAEASYTNGVKDGNWSVWNDKGVMLYHMVYDNGKRVLATQWDDNGTLIAGVQAK